MSVFRMLLLHSILLSSILAISDGEFIHFTDLKVALLYFRAFNTCRGPSSCSIFSHQVVMINGPYLLVVVVGLR